MNARPNLFDYATSELTQDAVLAWLLAWADHEAATHDPDLHRLGKAFVTSLLATHGLEPPGDKYAVKVVRQLKHIDVLFHVGARFVVAIEDKTHTGPHSDQLTRYRKEVEAMAGGRTPVLVYVKTGERRDDDYVRSKGWQPFGRKNLLDVLRGPAARGIENAILGDYVQHLVALDERATAWRRRRCSEAWTDHVTWAGLYSVLEQRLEPKKDLGWDYVANPSGGFMGLWWGFTSVDGGSLYVQLEQEKLTIKVQVHKKEDRKRLRDKWKGIVLGLESAKALGLHRPRRMGSGKYMTVALAEDGWRTSSNDGALGLDPTVDRLQAAAKLVQEAAAHEGA